MNYTEIYDGYRVRKTEKRGWVFLEGYPDPLSHQFLTPLEARRFNACLRRRGIPRLVRTLHP